MYLGAGLIARPKSESYDSLSHFPSRVSVRVRISVNCPKPAAPQCGNPVVGIHSEPRRKGILHPGPSRSVKVLFMNPTTGSVQLRAFDDVPPRALQGPDAANEP